MDETIQRFIREVNRYLPRYDQSIESERERKLRRAPFDADAVRERTIDALAALLKDEQNRADVAEWLTTMRAKDVAPHGLSALVDEAESIALDSLNMDPYDPI